jgi:hypothetical protein
LKIQIFITFLIAALLTACANNMVLYRDDIKGFDLAVDTLPKSPYCDVIQSEYKTGKMVVVAKGTRWVDSESAEKRRYSCRAGDIKCQNTNVSITNITKDRQHIFENCKRAKLNLRKHKLAEETKIEAQKIGDKTKRSLAFDNLLKILLDKKVIAHQEQQYLYFNFAYFTAKLIQEADITDLEGSLLLGTSQPIIKQLEDVPYPYQVQQVLDDMVILECGKCSLPPIGIRRVNGRPSPIEDQVFNDTRAIYQFVGTYHYRTVLNERKQVILFDRISMKSLKLPNNYLHEVMPTDFL